MTTSNHYTAVRTWNRSHKQATVTVYDAEGNEVCRAGGNRAARAQAVIIGKFKAEAPPDDGKVHGRWDDLGLYGVRGSLHAAQVEVEKLLRGGTRRTQGYVYQVSPWHFALAVPVTEAD